MHYEKLSQDVANAEEERQANPPTDDVPSPRTT